MSGELSPYCTSTVPVHHDYNTLTASATPEHCTVLTKNLRYIRGTANLLPSSSYLIVPTVPNSYTHSTSVSSDRWSSLKFDDQ